MAKWIGGTPENCDTCGSNIINVFYDAKTEYGAWGHLCPSCHHFGPGIGKLGSGYGQEYKKQPDGNFVKTAG
jgi:hypothetical protein